MNAAIMINDMMHEFHSGKYKKGERLPSENECAKKYGLTRIEVRWAYKHLKEQGMVYALQGRGYFYVGMRQPIELLLAGDVSFTEKMRQKKIDLVTINLGCQRLEEHDLNKFAHCAVYEIKRLRIIHGKPTALHISYLPEDLFPDLINCGNEILSLYQYFKSKLKQSFAYHNSEFYIAPLKPIQQEYFKTAPSAPYLHLQCQCVDEYNQVIEETRIIYQCDAFIFKMQ